MTPQERAKHVNFYSSIEQCMSEMADALESDAPAKEKAAILRKGAAQFRIMAGFHHSAAEAVHKAAGFDAGDELEPTRVQALAPDTPAAGLKLVGRAGGPPIPVGADIDPFMQKLLGVNDEF